MDSFRPIRGPEGNRYTLTNIQQIASGVWEATSEDRRYQVGARYAHFVKHADAHRKNQAEDYLRRVGGLKYRTEDILVAELPDKLRTLRAKHFGR